MRYIVLLKLKTRACHSIFGSVFGLEKSRRLLGYQMSSICPPTSEELPTPLKRLHDILGFRAKGITKSSILQTFFKKEFNKVKYP